MDLQSLSFDGTSVQLSPAFALETDAKYPAILRVFTVVSLSVLTWGVAAVLGWGAGALMHALAG